MLCVWKFYICECLHTYVQVNACVCVCMYKWLWSYHPFIRTSIENKETWNFLRISHALHCLQEGQQRWRRRRQRRRYILVEHFCNEIIAPSIWIIIKMKQKKVKRKLQDRTLSKWQWNKNTVHRERKRVRRKEKEEVKKLVDTSFWYWRQCRLIPFYANIDLRTTV